MRRDRAFSFLELMVAVAILSAGLMAVMRAFSITKTAVRRSARITRSALAASSALERTSFTSVSGISAEAARPDADCSLSRLDSGAAVASCAALDDPDLIVSEVLR
ncbi:MAG: type IV pilus modification PilV family protein [Deltaproteobacteria bacterium]